jgi:alpha-L-fucosidase
LEGINPYPWQTDTSIGDWFYNKNWKFRPVSWTIHMLVDIVSKNGNLLLNIVQRPDGSLDPEVEQALADLAVWIQINGAAIYGTRPWLVYGEGAVKAKGGHFKEDFAYTARDIRFTTKGRTLYAFALGWPEDGQLVIRSLAEVTGSRSNWISRVELLGHKGKLAFTQNRNGLGVRLPAQKPCDHAVALKITGRDLMPVAFDEPAPVIRPAADGSLKLDAETANLHGNLKVESRGSQSNIGFWDSADDWASWDKVALSAGTYEVKALISTVHANAQFVVEVARQKLSATAPNTGAWDKFETVMVGQVKVSRAGELTVNCKARDAQSWKAINLVRLELVKNN